MVMAKVDSHHGLALTLALALALALPFSPATPP
jgi:hypothetical protein